MTAWRGRAACRSVPSPDLFYDPSRLAEARSVCRGCPVRGSCLAEALLRREPLGVWGGLTPLERSRYRVRVEASELARVHDEVIAGASSTRELIDRLGIEASTLRRHLVRLERDGLVAVTRPGAGSPWQVRAVDVVGAVG